MKTQLLQESGYQNDLSNLQQLYQQSVYNNYSKYEVSLDIYYRFGSDELKNKISEKFPSIADDIKNRETNLDLHNQYAKELRNLSKTGGRINALLDNAVLNYSIEASKGVFDIGKTEDSNLHEALVLRDESNNNLIAGFIMFRVCDNPSKATQSKFPKIVYLEETGVAPQYQDRGCFKKMLSELAENLSSRDDLAKQGSAPITLITRNFNKAMSSLISNLQKNEQTAGIFTEAVSDAKDYGYDSRMYKGLPILDLNELKKTKEQYPEIFEVKPSKEVSNLSAQESSSGLLKSSQSR
ncbi:MAG: hypothetical protein FJX30_04475 [Alphaproteobacteria bacterium]|nr:hypothetical protein [Alphaproteobacteria bacterium]